MFSICSPKDVINTYYFLGVCKLFCIQMTKMSTSMIVMHSFLCMQMRKMLASMLLLHPWFFRVYVKDSIAETRPEELPFAEKKHDKLLAIARSSCCIGIARMLTSMIADSNSYFASG